MSLALFMSMGAACAHAAPGEPGAEAQRFIEVRGQGRAAGAPDVASLNLAVEVVAKTVGDARGQAAEAMRRVHRALDVHQIEARDRQTTALSVREQYDIVDRQRRAVGYAVVNGLRIRVRDLEALGDVIDDVLEAGGDAARFNGLFFDVDDRAALGTLARERAVADARARAEALAKAAGVKLGSVLYVNEGTGGGVPPPGPMKTRAVMDYAESGPPGTPVSEGEIEVSVDVFVRWAIRS